ncbi:MAG: SulP family inorganic anion transporter [Actinomycetota bacterium]
MKPVLERLGLEPRGIKDGAVAGFATGLFSIPEGMAYAQLAGAGPIYGLYAGIVATLVASLTTGSILMISTLTSAIALATGSVIDVAGVADSDIPRALFTVTLLVGGIMFVMGLLRLGNVVYLVSNAVMTGFVSGAALLIMIGQFDHFAGHEPEGANKIAETVHWFANVGKWDIATAAVGIATVVMMVALKMVKRTKKFAAVVTLFVMTIIVNNAGLDSVALVASIGEIPNSLPMPMLPAFHLMPELALGSMSVAIVALVQGAGINTAFPNPDGSRVDQSRDFVGQGLGNIAGSFFQSLGTGGSLSRTAISVSAGASSRWGGVFAAVWLGALVLLFGSLAERVPLTVISGLLFVIAAELILARWPSALMVVKASKGSTAAMLLTLVSALFIPLQWTIFLGAGLSLVMYIYSSFMSVKVFEMARNEDGRWEIRDLAETIRSHDVTVIGYQSAHFYAAVPRLRDMLPDATGTTGAAVIYRLRGLDEAHSTFLGVLSKYTQELRDGGNRLVLAGVEEPVYSSLKKTRVLEIVGEENVFRAEPGIGASLDHAYEDGLAWVEQAQESND